MNLSYYMAFKVLFLRSVIVGVHVCDLDLQASLLLLNEGDYPMKFKLFSGYQF